MKSPKENKKVKVSKKNGEEGAKPFPSLRFALLNDKELHEILQIKTREDIDLAVERFHEISDWSYKYNKLERRFQQMDYDSQLALAKKIANIYHVIYHRVNFAREFEALPPDERFMVTMQCLDVCKANTSGIKEDKATSTEFSSCWQKILQIMKREGAFIDTKEHTPVDRSGKMVIRGDAGGALKEPDEKYLSKAYRDFLDEKNKNPKKFAPNANKKYDLYTAPAWAYAFAQFKNFSDVEDKFQEALRFMNVPQSLLKDMNAMDFADVLYKCFAEQKYLSGKYKFRSVPLFRGSKFEYAKAVGNVMGDEIAEQFRAFGVDERYTRSFLREMRRFGTTANITPMEFICQQKHLDELTALGIDCSRLVPGQVYPDEFYDELFAKRAYEPLIAKDEFGEKVEGPEFDVDHQDPVDDAADYRIKKFQYLNLQAPNRWVKYRLVEKNVHRLFFHMHDVIKHMQDQKAGYIARVRLLPEYDDTAFVFSIEKDMRLMHDFSKDPYVVRQDKYFEEKYIPELERAEVAGKVSYPFEETKDNADGRIDIKSRKSGRYNNSDTMSEIIEIDRKKRAKCGRRNY